VGGAVPANDCCCGSKTVNQNESDEKIKVGGAVPANDCCYGSKTVNQYTRGSKTVNQNTRLQDLNQNRRV